MRMPTVKAPKTAPSSPVTCFTASRWFLLTSMPTTAPKPWYFSVPMTACCMRFWMSAWTFPVTKPIHGTEAWAFIPPDQLSRLKEIIEGSTHQDYVDSSPKIYFHDVDADGRVDSDDGDQVILICGLRKGGSGYFALDITDSDAPEYLWRIGNSNDASRRYGEVDQCFTICRG